jgi:hypothetical protein
MVDPDSWAYVDGDSLDAALNRGELVELQVPDSIPPETDPRAVPALEEAIADKGTRGDDDDPPQTNNAADAKSESAPPAEVRNTGAKTDTKNKRSRTETEA